MAIQTEVWQKFIIDNLFDSNPFLEYSFDESEHVNNKTVHIPNAGSVPTVERNRSSFPGTAAQRTDVDTTYDIDEFTTDPVHIADIEETETSYNKMDSVFGEHARQLAETAGDWMLYNWRHAGTGSDFMVQTTGSNYTAHATGANGNRKGLTGTDLLSAASVMDKNKVPSMNRYALIDYAMYNQLLINMGYTANRISVTEADLAVGIVAKFAGFNVLTTRSKVLFATAAGATRAPGHAGATTDSAIALTWQSDQVAKAVGLVKAFESLNDPLYYGNIISALLRSGGRKRRDSGYGVVGILQATP